MKSASHSVSLHVLLAATAIAAGTSAARATEVWHFLDYWHFHRADNVELCQGRPEWRKDKTYVDPLRAKINDHLNSWATVWQDRASCKWRMVYSAKWTPLTLMAAESDDGLDWRPLACPEIQPTGEKLAPHHIFILPGGSGGGAYLDPEARDGFSFKIFAHQMGEEVQLYNLADDLGETKNLAAAMPEKVAEMKALLEKLITDGRSTPGAAKKNDVEVKRYPAESAATVKTKKKGRPIISPCAGRPS